VIFFGMGVTMTRGKHANSEALLALTRDMNRYTRFTCKPNRGHGNVTGADNVVTWRTGYPFGVNLGRGYPRFNPGEYTASDVLARGEADAALIIASDPMANFSQPAREHLKDPLHRPGPQRDADHPPRRRGLHVATYGINVPGTVYRMDDVPIPLRPAFESPGGWHMLLERDVDVGGTDLFLISYADMNSFATNTGFVQTNLPIPIDPNFSVGGLAIDSDGGWHMLLERDVDVGGTDLFLISYADMNSFATNTGFVQTNLPQPIDPNFSVNGFEIVDDATAVVPEPTTISMLSLGLLLVTFRQSLRSRRWRGRVRRRSM
jgi:hypothetical protein